jgi:addiction module HigA family antidote
MSKTIRRMHPGRVLREEYIDPTHLNLSALAEALDVPLTRITQVTEEQEPMTSDLALRLARYFRTSPQFWLGLQTSYDLATTQAQFGAEIEARVQPLAA